MNNMEIIIGEEERQEVLSVANRSDVDSDKLWGAYQEVMKSNFFEDLCDIARENEEELKGE